MSTSFPTLRVTLESMRHEMLHAFGLHNKAVEKKLADEATKLIENFDFEAAVKATMEPLLKEAIRQALEDHFRYGAGRELIAQGVKAALQPRPD